MLAKMMAFRVSTRILFFIPALWMVGQAASANPVGLWRSETNDQGASISVQIGNCGNEICGKVADIHNSSDLSAMGVTMITGMTSRDNVNYSGGKIYAPDQEKWYRARMRMLSNDRLQVSGCVLGGVICRSQVWTRIQ